MLRCWFADRHRQSGRATLLPPQKRDLVPKWEAKLDHSMEMRRLIAN